MRGHESRRLVALCRGLPGSPVRVKSPGDVDSGGRSAAVWRPVFQKRRETGSCNTTRRLRAEAVGRIDKIGAADVLVGIPCYNNQETLAHVLRMVSDGLAAHYKDKKSVILIADGGSTDDSRETALDLEVPAPQEKIVSIYRGMAGKGTALRSVFEAADRLGVQVCAMVDSDLRSITPEWVKYLAEPVLEDGYQFVAPVYVRHKYDGTITNNVVYNLTRALYGKRIRQPIGGDFAISGDAARFYARQDVWQTDVARFGIDIWMTTTAVAQGFRVCQANLGVKIHDAKDPGQHLAPMFRQVLSALFALMEQYESTWKAVEGSEPVPTFGLEGLAGAGAGQREPGRDDRPVPRGLPAFLARCGRRSSARTAWRGSARRPRWTPASSTCPRRFGSRSSTTWPPRSTSGATAGASCWRR